MCLDTSSNRTLRKRCLPIANLGHFLFSFLFITSILYGIRYPVSPDEPKTPSVEGLDSSPKETGKRLDKVTQKSIRVKAALGSGDELTGFIKAPQKIQFKHYKNGLVYKKTILIKDILSIEIISFRKELVRQEKEHRFYEFRASQIKIVAKDKNEFQLNYLFKFLQKFRIDTSDGVTTLYSFFADEFHKKKGWSEVESKDESYHDQNPHPQSVKKIWFYGWKDEEFIP